MDEILLIDMMSELSAELLQDNYIEKDMVRGRIPILGSIFSFSKSKRKNLDLPSLTEEEERNPLNQYGFSTEHAEELTAFERKSDYDNLENRELPISIFTKEFPLVKIISGFAAALFVMGGIILFIIKHHKSIFKFFEKKTQMIY
jgi:hypothetical protein